MGNSERAPLYLPITVIKGESTLTQPRLQRRQVRPPGIGCTGQGNGEVFGGRKKVVASLPYPSADQVSQLLVPRPSLFQPLGKDSLQLPVQGKDLGDAGGRRGIVLFVGSGKFKE